MTRRLVQGLVAAASFAALGIAAAQTTPATAASAPVSAAKKELVQRLIRLQQSDIEGFARSVVENPAAQMMREAGLALQSQTSVPAEKRQAAAHAIEAEVKKYVEEAYPVVRDRALKLAPSTMGAVFEAKMSEDELKLLVAWLESPTAKKYQQLGPELRSSFSQKLVSEMPGVLNPKLKALDGRIRTILGVGPAGAPPQAPAEPAAPAPAARPASK